MNVLPTCPHFSLCSGCTLERNFFEPPIKEEMLAFFQKQNAPLSFHSDGFAQTRWKAKLAVRGTISDPKIGLFKKGTHETLPIPNCLVHHPAINTASSLLLDAIRKHKIAPYAENPPRGLIRYVQFFVERETGRVQLALSINSTENHLDPLLDDLKQNSLWHSIWINFHPDANNRIFGDSWIRYSGDPWLWQRFGDAEVAFHPASFSQAHLPLFDQMLQTIESWVPENSSCLELFAGTGAISLFIRKRCQKIDLVENNPFSALSFQESLAKLAPDERKRLSYRLEEASSPIGSYDAIIVDPPRKGLGKPLLEELSQNTSPRLIYVSCDFGSFQKDCEQLIAGGWKLVEGRGYFLFPGTNAIETLAIFDKK